MAAFGALLMGEHVYLKEFITTDENSYLFQAWLFLQGKISAPVPPGIESFARSMIINDEQAGWLSRYPPAHSVWLMPGVAIDYPRIMVAVAAFWSVWFITKAAERLQIPIWIVVGLLFVSPYFWLMQGSVLSHTSGLMATAIMMWAYLAWFEDRKNSYLVIAGLAWAFLFLNRTFTAFLIAIPFGLHILYVLFRSRTIKDLIATVVFASCAIIGVIVFFIYNYRVTGDPFLPTYLYYNRLDGLGFGIRNQLDYNFTPAEGWEFIKFNLSTLNIRLWGFWGSLIALLGLTLVGWRTKGISLMMLAGTLLVWLGYGAFWFKGIEEVAPVYYYETLVFVVLLAGLGVHRLLQMDWHIPSWSKALTCLFVAAFVGQASARTFYKYGVEIIQRSADKAQYQKMIKAVPPNSIVLIHGFPRGMMYETLWNPKGLQSDPLIMKGGFSSRHLIHHYYPDRKVYLVEGTPPKAPKFIGDISAEIPHLSAARMGSAVGIKNGKGFRIAAAPEDGRGPLAYGIRHYFVPGVYEIKFFLKASGKQGEVPGIVDVLETKNGTRLAYKELVPGEEIVTFKIEVDELTLIEPRVHYSGEGRLEFDRIEMKLLSNKLEEQETALN